MNPEHDPQLDALLQSWKPQIEMPRHFRSEVWRRIALAQEKRSDFWRLRLAFSDDVPA